MEAGGFEIVCPVCAGALVRADEERLDCEGCRRAWPVILGIPDLRTRPDPYIGIEQDRAKGIELSERCAGLDFPASIRQYYAMTPAVTPAQAKLFERGLLGAETRAAQALDAWESKAGAGDGSALLEIGCGTAPLLIAARERYARVIGIDIAFRWLVMAKKRLQDAGLDLPLICANAESLPFRAETFDRLVADSVLEHVYDQPLVAREGLRVLAADGRLFIATPNRHSLGPDPHVGVWGAGLLPERLLGWYVRRTGGIPPRRQLLSVGGLERLLRSTGYADIRVFLPDVGADQRARFGGVTRMAIDGYHLVKRLPVGGPVLRAIGPLLDAVATRPARPTEAH
jgi:SAM-dependent methyltransferase/uncharacterized protein YbaR (Trm112 family)